MMQIHGLQGGWLEAKKRLLVDSRYSWLFGASHARGGTVGLVGSRLVKVIGSDSVGSPWKLALVLTVVLELSRALCKLQESC